MAGSPVAAYALLSAADASAQSNAALTSSSVRNSVEGFGDSCSAIKLETPLIFYGAYVVPTAGNSRGLGNQLSALRITILPLVE